MSCSKNKTRLRYTAVCNDTSQCDTSKGLYCPLVTDTCNCPKTSSFIFCDCQRVSNNEYYWNGSSCISSKLYGQSCSNALTSYQCQTMTQGTICNNKNGIFECDCSYLKYFNNITNSCLNQLSINQTCSYDSQCQNVFALICIDGTCKYRLFFL